jgi:hypothetical protein
MPTEGVWVAACDPLKLTVQSDTWAELMEDIGLTLNAMMCDLLQTNELDRFLRDRGWRLVEAVPDNPANVRFDLPFIPQMDGANGTPRFVH